MNLTTLGPSGKWNHTVFVFWCLTYFTEQNVFTVHLYYSIGRISFYLRLSSITLYVNATCGLALHPSVDIWVAPHVDKCE